MDESFVYDNEAPTYGRNLESYMEGVHDPLISTEKARDENFLDYVRNTLVPNLQEGDVEIWDRLSKEKRARTEEEVRSIVKESCDKITETAIEGYFRERGDGREFKRLLSDLL
ncbi:hypothetical protein HDU92_004330 [Lobulomyces angularis]|nr:hypothetical protein HDU92_004330 [Lobulomyces angularis]